MDILSAVMLPVSRTTPLGVPVVPAATREGRDRDGQRKERENGYEGEK
jgi:hypothetical protein